MDIAAIGVLAYGLIAAVVLIDSVVPFVPSEALVVTAAGSTATDGLSVVGVLGAAAAGAFAGEWTGECGASATPRGRTPGDENSVAA